VAGPGTFHVLSASVQADPAEYTGHCPVTITFTARIAIDADPGIVRFHWLSSDGAVSPQDTVTFAGSRGMEVHSTWRVDPKRLPTHAGWSSIQIDDPPTTLPGGPTATHAAFAFTCDTDTDIESLTFGRGSSDDCGVTGASQSFNATDTIRVVAIYKPALSSGTVVTFDLTKDGQSVEGFPTTSTLDKSATCVRAHLAPGLDVGRYRLDVEPDTARAIGGDFDIKDTN
jgi:hypothetical protein